MNTTLEASFPSASVYKSHLGSRTYLNTTDKMLLREDVTMLTLKQTAVEFYHQVYLYVLNTYQMPSKMIGNKQQPVILAFQGHRYLNEDGLPTYNCFRTKLSRIPWHVRSSVGCTEDMTLREQAEMILDLSVEEQQMLYKSAAGDTIDTLKHIMVPGRVRQLVCPELSRLLAKHTNALLFIKDIAEKAEGERAYFNLSSHAFKPPQQERTAIYDAFIFFCANRDLLLRPYQSKAFYREQTGIDYWMMSDRTAAIWAQAQDYLRLHRKIKSDRVLSTKTSELKVSFNSLISCSTVRGPETLSSDLISRYISDLREKGAANNEANHFVVLFNCIKALAKDKALIPAFAQRKRKNYPGRFPWTYLQYSEETKFLYPLPTLSGYSPDPRIIIWGETFATIFTKVETKTIAAWQSACNNFLTWLFLSKVEAKSLKDLRRFDINDGGSVADSKCFRSYILKCGHSAQYTNNIISRLSDIFDKIIYENDFAIANPIVVKFDTIKDRTRRVKTPRHPLGREMLEFIRELNARDNFAFSRNRTSHQRTLVHPRTEKPTHVWFPGVAICLDFLLRIPVRGFQARHLDTGEGDEYLVNLGHLQSPIKNRLPAATKGRRECVLCGIPSFGEETVLGIYINTNKTNVDRVEGYEIPWCDDSLLNHLTTMIDWQKEYNPIATPVLCSERGRAPDNPDVIRSMKKTYPVFRDPADTDNRPFSRDMITRYWDDLMYYAEQEILKEQGREIKLTELVTYNKGNSKTEQRRVSRFDIHTLRVSGITALIEAGLPPDMVMSVAGHSTIVMTMYYNKPKISTLNKRLSEALVKSSHDLGKSSMTQEELSTISEFLTNSRVVEDQAGQFMLHELSGKGDGSVEVMAHGICPGGECASGGPYLKNELIGYGPVPRPLACPLCRYRLTGPMFLPGLVANANRLMLELRRKGQEIAVLQREIKALGANSAEAALKRSRIRSLYKETDVVCEEWGAEIAYVRTAETMLTQWLQASASAEQDALPMISGEVPDAVISRLEQKSEFALLQALTESVYEWKNFKCEMASIEHREILNEILAANNIDPFLLRLSGDIRDKSAILIGRAITRFVPDESIDDLRKAKSLEQYASVGLLLEQAATLAKNYAVDDEAYGGYLLRKLEEVPDGDR